MARQMESCPPQRNIVRESHFNAPAVLDPHILIHPIFLLYLVTCFLVVECLLIKPNSVLSPIQEKPSPDDRGALSIQLNKKTWCNPIINRMEAARYLVQLMTIPGVHCPQQLL